MPEKLNPLVLDLSHHNYDDNGKTYNFKQAKAWGVRGIIYKATEGLTYKDPTYQLARKLATEAGLLWGAYHFFRPGDPYKQARHFVDTAKPEPGTLMVLDHEDKACSASMAESFLRSLEQIIKRPGMLYTYDAFIKEQLGSSVNAYLGDCRLWIAKYGSEPTCQASWDSYWLWQFTGDGMGPLPHDVPGIGKKVDINHFPGSEEELISEWVLGPADAEEYEPTMAELSTWGQATLNLLGEANLLVDGKFGKLSKQAVAKYQLEKGITITNQLDQPTVLELLRDTTLWNSNRDH